MTDTHIAVKVPARQLNTKSALDVCGQSHELLALGQSEQVLSPLRGTTLPPVGLAQTPLLEYIQRDPARSMGITSPTLVSGKSGAHPE